MSVNKQSVSYTIIYIVVLVVVVAAALAGVSIALTPRQNENADADKMKQILASVHIVPDSDVVTDFNRYITAQAVVNVAGDIIGDDAFSINVAEQSKIADLSERKLPVYMCTLSDGSEKYIIPVYGAGLWGPIWGYVAIDSDGSTVYGAYFAHQGETPGLGAEIEKPAFSGQFESKHLFKDGRFMPVTVVKAGQKPAGDEDYVDGVSGGTITSKGVGEMLQNCISPYEAYLNSLRNK